MAISSLTLACNSLISLSFIIKLLSSAKSIKVECFVTWAKSFIYRINNKGPSTDPCGIPHFTTAVEDFTLLNETYCVLVPK